MRIHRKVCFATIFTVSVVFSSCHIARFFYYNFADINDYKKFPATELHRSDQPCHFIKPDVPGKSGLTNTLRRKRKKYTLVEGLRKNGNVAFIGIRNDSI